jgi:hypothetical protein
MRSQNMVRRILGLAVAVAGASVLAPKASAATIYAIDDQNNLFTFDNQSPQNIITGTFVTGLKPNEHLTNIDFRSVDGVLYGVGSSYQVYTINPATGVATPRPASFGPVQGNSFGMDLNPVTDLMRFYSDTDNNVRIDPNSGLVVDTDPNLAYAPGDPNAGKNPSVVGAGFTNSVNPLPLNPTTTLYGIDSNTDSLVRVGSVGGSPISGNTGQLFTVGTLGTDTGNFVGFDISANNIGFASLLSPGSSASRLYAVDLATGHATDQGQIIGGVRVVDIATEPNVNFVIPEPASLMMLGALSLCAGLRRRRA